MVKHFNINILEKSSNNINLNDYIKNVTIDNYKKVYKTDIDEIFVEEQKKRIKYNYELNMKYFDSLTFEEFDKYITKFTIENKFQEVFDLNKYDNIPGIYIMVFDNYNQAYIGISESNIKKRIQTHWNSVVKPNRLIFGRAYNSIISVDSFWALDNTRIFVKNDLNLHINEYQMINNFDSKYLLNRTDGGIGCVDTYTDDTNSAKIAVHAGIKTRNFTKYIDENELCNKCNSLDIDSYKNNIL